MRDWLRDLMRRRSKRGPNESESTGKIGQELPQNQPAPLQPSYRGDAPTPAPKETESAPQPPAPAPAHKAKPPAAAVAAEPVGTLAAASSEPAGKLVLETQPESLSHPAPRSRRRNAKGPRGYVVLTIGLPGSGKTTWYKRRGVTPLSSDLLRSILFDDITEQRYQGLVFSTLRSLLRARLIAKMPWNYVDATNLSPHERRQWIKMAKSFGYEVQAVFFDVPLAVCLERNKARPPGHRRSHAQDGRAPPPASLQRRLRKITVVRVKGAAASGGPGTSADEE